MRTWQKTTTRKQQRKRTIGDYFRLRSICPYTSTTNLRLTDIDYDKNDIKQFSSDFRRDSFDEYGIIYYATIQCAKRYF